MAGLMQISVECDPRSGQMRVKILRVDIPNPGVELFAVIYILPGWSLNKRVKIERFPRELLFTVQTTELPLTILEVFLYEVGNASPINLVGQTIVFSTHKCLGNVQVPWKDFATTKNVILTKNIVKCEDLSNKAKATCQLLCFKEDVRAFLVQFAPSVRISTLVEEKAVNKTFNHFQNEIDKSRAPVLYLIGRSGEGKSSLINGLANRLVAEVGVAQSTTATSKSYLIEFDGGTMWQVYDTRGLSETTVPDGATGDPVTQMKKEIASYKPDAIVYVVSARGIRNCMNELNILYRILRELKRCLGVVPPVVTVLTQADLYGGRYDWPPEDFATKQQELKKLLDITATDVMKAAKSLPIYPRKPFYGYKIEGDIPVLFVVPVAVPVIKDGPLWNIETLSLVLGKLLPLEALLQFYQAQKRPCLMKEYTNSLIKYFSVAAAAVGVLPVPGSDVVVLTILQLIMIAFIAWKSGRDLSLKTTAEFLGAMGLTYVAGQCFLKLTQGVIKLCSQAGSIISVAVSGIGTYSLGKSAQAYFFDGAVQDPREFKHDEREQTGSLGDYRSAST